MRNVTYNKIAILGNSQLKWSPDGFNAKILDALLKQIKKQDPKALFFTGNLVYGLKTEVKDNAANPELLQTKNIFGRVVRRIHGIYESALFAKQLEAFANLIKANMGTIPFYPLPGENESLGPDSQEIFRKQFNIPSKQGAEGPNFSYSVPIDNAVFTLLGTDHLDSATNRPVITRFDEALLSWLNKSLEETSKKYSYSFVLGNDPVFSTESVFGHPQGLDQNLKSARQFWKALWKNHVMAYICGNEVLYDRTFDKGVWQIISGGAGARSPFAIEKDNTFYHYVLIYIPQGPVGKVFLEVYDVNGKLRDRFVLSQQAPIIHDFRISTD